MNRTISARAMRLHAIFGIMEPGTRPPPWCGPAARELDAALGPGGIALICGPSGAGKSAILRALARRLRARGATVVVARPARRPDRTVIDLVPGGVRRAMSLLARAGLAEAGVMLGRAAHLSEGQKARLAIALAMGRARPGATLMLDEFASTLDRPAAVCLSWTLRRWARAAPGVRVVCATAHDDLLEALAPDVLVEQRLGEPAVLSRRGAA